MRTRYLWLFVAVLFVSGWLAVGLQDDRRTVALKATYERPRDPPRPFTLDGRDSIVFCGVTYDLHRPFLREGLQDALDYFRDRQGWLAMTQRRQGRYGPLIRQELASRGLHSDLRLMFAWESELNRWARSWADAAGIAQFMPLTAAGEGLLVNAYVDERYDPYQSIPAGCRYLAVHQPYFRDYLLLLAAYNAGPYATNARVQKQGTDDYFLLFQRPETMRYVFWLLAMKLIEEERLDWLPQLSGMQAHQPLLPVSRRVQKLSRTTTLRQLSEACGYDYELFLFLNPQLRRAELPAGISVPINYLAHEPVIVGFGRANSRNSKVLIHP